MSTETSGGPMVRYLGGESAHRGFFGGHGAGAKARPWIVGAVVAGGLVATPLMGWPALATTMAAVLVVLILTAPTHNGSIVERHQRRTRWARRQRLGTDRFVPYDADRWASLEAAATAGTRKERAAAARDMAAMRAMPDGADGMGWLQSAVNVPGIAWHSPLGEEPYLSVAFRVAGQIRGVESHTTLTAAGVAWGQFLADHAKASSLVGSVQVLTRVLPPDTARHQAWAEAAVDPNAPAVAVASYAEVIEQAGAGAMAPRHYVVVSWPITTSFIDAASRYGEGRDGWRALMAREIASTGRALSGARLGAVAPLTARQTVALMLHQQNPTRPVDAVRGVDPAAPGLRSHDEYAAHVVEATDYETHRDVEWWHRTAAITADGLSVGGRRQLWVIDLLLGADLDFVRSVTFHMRLVPAMHAKAAAGRDLTADESAALSDAQKGKRVNDQTTLAASAAARRVADLAAGSHHHGVEWVGFVTVSAPSRDELQQACRALADTCSTSLGIERLTWLDSYQAAASGTTWPIGRGLRPGRAGMTEKAYTALAGRGDKEAL